MVHVGPGLVVLLGGNQSFDPSRIKIDKKTRTTPFVGKMLDGEPESAWPSWTYHHPEMVSGKCSSLKVSEKAV